MTSTCCPASCNNEEALSWLLCPNTGHVSSGLQILVDLAQEDKSKLVEKFLQHCNPELYMEALQKQLKSRASWLRSTTAYIFGVLLENESVVLKLQKGTEENKNLICDLAQMLCEDESDVVMNAAGAIASLVETIPGRVWFLGSQGVFSKVLKSVSVLLENERGTTVNSAALIFARLSLCEESCERVLSHSSASKTFRCLVQCLSCSHKDTAMNAAFAVGRLWGSRQTKSLILKEAKDHHLVSRLQALLLPETGVEMGQAVCFALSCLANDEDGHALLMESTSVPALLHGLSQLLQSPDPDSIWFAAMTVRMLVSHASGVVSVRMHSALYEKLKLLSISTSTGPDLQEEVNMCLRRLERLSKPSPVTVTVTNLSSTSCTVSWEKCDPESGLEVTYSLFDRDVMLYHGPLCNVTLPIYTSQSVEPLCLQLSLSTCDGDISPLSEPVVITREQLDTSVKPPQELCVIGFTATQARLCWTEPEGGTKPKSYQIYCNDTLVKTTTLLRAKVTGLSPGTTYQLSVSSRGPGDTESPKAVTEVKTAKDGDHAPSALTVVVMGRHELQINWGAPFAPLGRLFKYELSLNGGVVYLGTERAYTAHHLCANTAYTCTVTAITSRGRCQSSPVTKKTARDEYMHSNSHQTASTPSSSIQVMHQVRKNGTILPALLKPEVQHTMVPHTSFEQDKHRRVSVQKHSPKATQSATHTTKHTMAQDGVILQFNFPTFGDSMLQKMDALRRDRRFCDVVVRINDLEVPGHKVVFAAGSPFLRDQFVLQDSHEVQIPTQQDAEVGQRLLLSCYTGTLEFPELELVHYLTVASFLQMSHIVEQCTEALNKFIKPHEVKDERASSRQTSDLRGALAVETVCDEEDEVDNDGDDDFDDDDDDVIIQPKSPPVFKNTQSNGRGEDSPISIVKVESLDEHLPDNFQSRSTLRSPEPQHSLINSTVETRPAEIAVNPTADYSLSPPGPSGSGKGSLWGCSRNVDKGMQWYHQCPKCSRVFRQLENYANHLKMHKLFMCLLCGKTFTQKGNLHRHMRVHAGIKPFQCKICGKTFTQKCSLLDHLNLHSGDKPHRCNYCDMVFAHKPVLRKHLKQIHGKNSFDNANEGSLLEGL